MREINKTIYQLVKVKAAEEDVNVTQLITDEVVKQKMTGEVESYTNHDASGILDKKALELQALKQDSTGIKKQVKASGAKSRSSAAGAKNSTSAKVSSNTQKSNTGKKVPAKKKSANKRLTQQASPKQAPKKDSSSNLMLILAIVLMGAGLYFLYTQGMLPI